MSNLEPLVSIVNKPNLSLLVAYFYLTLQNITEKISVEPKFLSVMKKFFPFVSFVVPDEEDTGSIWAITRVNASNPLSLYREGHIMMPVFVGETNSEVYNIHKTNANTVKYTQQYLSDALNFFNCVVRNNNTGITSIVWKDPVTSDTKLRDENYDEMFLLYIADMYLKAVDEGYPYIDKTKTLSLCLRFAEVFRRSIDEDATVRVMTPEIASAVVLIDTNKSRTVELIEDVEVDVDKNKERLFVLLYFLSIIKANKDEKFVLQITGFDSYSYLKTVVKMYTKCVINVWTAKSFESTSERIKVNGVMPSNNSFAAPKGYTKVVFVSGLAKSDILLKKFFKDGGQYALVKYNSTRKTPKVSFLSCFGDAGVVNGYIIPRHDKENNDDEAERLRELLVDLRNNLDTNYRDVKKWLYVPSPEHIKSVGKSYDEMFLSVLLSSK